MTTGWLRALWKGGDSSAESPSAWRGVEEPGSTRALIVDDSEVARRALATMLEAAGFDVTTAASAREAEVLIAACTPGGFDVVLMDLHMPSGTGIEACARIKQQPGWDDVPVIVVTGSDDEGDLTLAFAAGATDYLNKPPREVELMARVRAALRLKREMTARRAHAIELEALNRRLRQQTTELSDAKSALQEVNRDLERRVRVQVDEMLTRAREIDGLNAQLRVQVQERSRELAEALRRLSGQGRRQRTLTPGKVLRGRVQIVRPLAKGGMGLVYAGQDLVSGRPVAVKVLELRAGLSERDLQRFIHEAGAAAAIAHAAVVKTTHVDVTADGDLFLIMELVNGMSLDVVLATGPLAPAWCISIGRVAADALAAAHRVDIIHRDVKPANLMMCRHEPGIRVLDFGISKIRPVADRVTLTQTDGLLGTPAYMAPEQLEDAAGVTPATDVFSLGAVMFEILTGQRPFLDLRARLHGHDAPRLADRVPDVPSGLAGVVDRCLARSPAARPSADELARQLTALATDMDAPPPHSLLDRLRDRLGDRHRS